MAWASALYRPDALPLSPRLASAPAPLSALTLRSPFPTTHLPPLPSRAPPEGAEKRRRPPKLDRDGPNRSAPRGPRAGSGPARAPSEPAGRPRYLPDASAALRRAARPHDGGGGLRRRAPAAGGGGGGRGANRSPSFPPPPNQSTATESLRTETSPN